MSQVARISEETDPGRVAHARKSLWIAGTLFLVTCASLWLAAWIAATGPLLHAMEQLQHKKAAATQSAGASRDAARVYLISRAAPR